MKFKHGDRVKCAIRGFIIEDARISISNGKHYICQDVVPGAVAEDTLGYKYSWHFDPLYVEYSSDVKDLKLLPRKLSEVMPQAGDLITTIHQRDASRKVLGVCGEMVFCSFFDDHVVFDYMTTIHSLRNHGYKFKEEFEPPKALPAPKEFTMDEIAKAVGVPVDQLRIKKDNQ